MAAVAGPSWTQTSIIDELLEAIQQHPDSIDARKLLAEQYQILGWQDAAADVAENILLLDPGDESARAILSTCRPKAAITLASPKTNLKPVVNEEVESPMTVKELKEQYKSLKEEAAELLQELEIFRQLAPDIDISAQLADVEALAQGRVFSVARRRVGSIGQGKGKGAAVGTSARALAESMTNAPAIALEIAFADFEAVVKRMRAGVNGRDSDAVRSVLRKRMEAVKSSLPTDVAHIASDTFMHIEHETLKRQYLNAETMYSDPVSGISRSNFWASEDGYAWDMSELVQALKAKNGAMRNPLTHMAFSVADIEAILRHHLGAQLAALHVEQKSLVNGVRGETIKRMQALSKILNDDLSENSHPSHTAVEDFLAYLATLPDTEKKAIDSLRVPAVDSHTKLPFDDTIGDAVRDAKANRICFHKAGDLLKQAGEFLVKQQKGKARL